MNDRLITSKQKGGTAIAGFLLISLLALPLFGADSLTWDGKTHRVSADVKTWTLSTLLERVSESTGWEVFVEPESKAVVSARFEDQPAGEALRRLLGNLNFALLPQTNAPAKLFIFHTSLQGATQQVKTARPKRSRTGTGIPDELVVTLKDGASIEDIAARVGARMVGGIDELDTFRLKFEDEEAAKRAAETLAGLTDVTDVGTNYYVEPPLGADLLAASSSPALALNPVVAGDGSQTIIGLIDTAIQRQGSPISGILLDSLSAFGSAHDPGGMQPLHSTSMANGIGQGLSAILDKATTNVRILPVDVYGPNATATTFDVAYGIAMAINAGATIINLSLGSEGNSTLLQSVIQNGSQKGIVFIAAAGNTPVTTPFYPAAYPEVIAATAGDRKGNIASYANYGDFVDVVAPGANVVSYNNNSWFVSGTSTSAAYVSGLVAGVASQTGVSVSEAANRAKSVLTIPTLKK